MRDKPKEKTYRWARVSVAAVIVCLMIGALLILKSAINRFDIPKFQISRATSYLENGKVEKAARLVAKLEKTVPPAYLSRLQDIEIDLANEYVKLGDIEKAEAMAAKLTKEGYGYESEMGFLEASILQARGRYLEAIEAFENISSVTFCGNCSAERRNRKRVGKGECHESLGNFKDAYVEYLLCIPNMGLTMAVEPLLGMRRLRPKLSEVEKKEVYDLAFGILLRFMRENRENVLYAREIVPEDTQGGWRMPDEDRASYGYLYEEAERFGIMSALERAEKKLQSAHDFEDAGRYNDAFLEYVECIAIPWLYSTAEPVESLISLERKLKGSESKELDARMAEKLRKVMGNEDARSELQSFAMRDSELTRWWLGPESVVYPLLLDEAERLEVDAPISAAEMRLKIARYYDGTDSYNASNAYEAYVDCIKLPWPYSHAEPVEKLPGLRKKLKDYEREGVDTKTRAMLAELLSDPEVKEKIESLARPGAESVDFGEPEHAVYAFLLAESRRLGLLSVDSGLVDSVR